MHSKNKRIFIGIMAVLAVAAAIVWIFNSHLIPEYNVKPVPRNVPTLNEADIEKLLGVEQFRIVRGVRQVPITIKESFSNFTKLPFDLANPGEEISSDAIIPGRSSRRLVFLALSEDSAVLVYEQGGYIDTLSAVIFWFGDGGRDWGTTLNSRPDDISSLRALIQKGQFQTWEHRE
jgi:hypothetical protein